MELALVVLAAGLGSRYGGLKQLDPVGPSGEIILDYSLFDAARAGFTRVVFVIREETQPAFHDRFSSRIPAGLTAAYAFQSISDLPPPVSGLKSPVSNLKSQISNREKPWGTGHAVWCARNAVQTPFAVINADDFYGQTAFKSLATFLRRAPPNVGARLSGEIPRFAMVGYKLSNTLSEHGLVSRGICDVGPLAAPKPGEGGAAKLRTIVEQKGIAPTDVGPGRKFTGTETVSMNCWAFTPDLFPALETELRTFLATHAPSPMRAEGPHATRPEAEFYLPAAISTMVAQGTATVEVLPTQDSWFGVTYREDRPKVASALATLVSTGTYPANLSSPSSPR